MSLIPSAFYASAPSNIGANWDDHDLDGEHGHSLDRFPPSFEVTPSGYTRNAVHYGHTISMKESTYPDSRTHRWFPMSSNPSRWLTDDHRSTYRKYTTIVLSVSALYSTTSYKYHYCLGE